jgi:hypothetical protein
VTIESGREKERERRVSIYEEALGFRVGPRGRDVTRSYYSLAWADNIGLTGAPSFTGTRAVIIPLGPFAPFTSSKLLLRGPSKLLRLESLPFARIPPGTRG